jgi:hypothetical protein
VVKGFKHAVKAGAYVGKIHEHAELPELFSRKPHLRPPGVPVQALTFTAVSPYRVRRRKFFLNRDFKAH